MVHKYVPLLRWKQGEKQALLNLSAAARIDVVPLILLGSDNFKDKKQTKNVASIPAAEHFAHELAEVWGTSPIYLDATAIGDTPGQSHRLTDIAAAARAMSSMLIPATTLGASLDYQAAVVAASQADGRGVCLRIDLQEMTSLSTWLENWPVPVPQTDLIVDLGENVAVVAALGSTLFRAFSSLHQGTHWRSVTIAGTSMPENFTGYRAGLHLIPRSERVLWTKLTASVLPYKLDFADYATVSTGAPPTGIAWGHAINAKYTLASEFLICRGLRTTGLGAVDMEVQLVQHAQNIVSHPARGALSTCWADQAIDDIAASRRGPGDLAAWLGLGVNRHIELTRSLLK
jgi:hypothetical protein